jgi:transcriptional regulator with XRE-family HTH domain
MRKMTQTELADLAGMKQPDITKIEKGLIQKTTGIARLAKALSVQVEWLELGDGPEPDWRAIPKEDESLRNQLAHSMSYLRAKVEPQAWGELTLKAQSDDLDSEFWAVLPDDAIREMAPAGTKVKFTTGLEPSLGDAVLLVDPTGRLLVREYREHLVEGWEGHAHSEIYARVPGNMPGVRIVAVATGIETRFSMIPRR